MELEWKDPPIPVISQSLPTRLEELRGTLKANPGRWARIGRSQNPLSFPWWSSLMSDSKFETVSIKLTKKIFGPVDVYIRSRPKKFGRR